MEMTNESQTAKMVTDAEVAKMRESHARVGTSGRCRCARAFPCQYGRLLADRERWKGLLERVNVFVLDGEHDHADLGEFVPACVFCAIHEALKEAGRGDD